MTATAALAADWTSALADLAKPYNLSDSEDRAAFRLVVRDIVRITRRDALVEVARAMGATIPANTSCERAARVIADTYIASMTS